MSKRILGNLLLLLAMGLGLISGLSQISFLNDSATVISDLFLRLLKLISLPIIFLAVTSTITGMKDFHEMRRMGRKVLLYTLATTIIAAAIALTLYLIIHPAQQGVNVQGKDETSVPSSIKQTSYFSFILNIIPSNVFGAFTEGNVMGIVFIALALSFAILVLPEEQKVFLNKFFSGMFGAMIKLTGFIISLMPLAIWAFVTLLVKDFQQNFEHFNRLVLYLSCVVSANLIQGLIVLPLLLKLKKVPVWKSVKGMMPALTVAFFTKSSNATLPIAMRSVEKNLGVSQKVSNFSLPLCSVINMNGCAAFILITTLFVSTLHGYTFHTFDYIGWVFLATLAAIGNAGVPMGCYFLTSAFLIGMDVPLFMMGLILPFYTILDMIETTLNVWSDACITTVVDKELAPQETGVPEISKNVA